MEEMATKAATTEAKPAEPRGPKAPVEIDLHDSAALHQS